MNGNKFFGEFAEGRMKGHGKYYEGEKKIAEGTWDDGFLKMDNLIREVLGCTLNKANT